VRRVCDARARVAEVVRPIRPESLRLIDSISVSRPRVRISAKFAIRTRLRRFDRVTQL
jgi:hypothetical protein